MKKRTRTIITIFLILSIVMCNRLMLHSTIRTIEFLSILICGIFAGLLLSFFLPLRKDREN